MYTQSCIVSHNKIKHKKNDSCNAFCFALFCFLFFVFCFVLVFTFLLNTQNDYTVGDIHHKLCIVARMLLRQVLFVGYFTHTQWSFIWRMNSVFDIFFLNFFLFFLRFVYLFIVRRYTVKYNNSKLCMSWYVFCTKC